jgi:hypothetical protein
MYSTQQNNKKVFAQHYRNKLKRIKFMLIIKAISIKTDTRKVSVSKEIGNPTLSIKIMKII